MKQSTLLAGGTLALIVTTGLVLSACDTKDEPLTVGQRLDQTVAQAEADGREAKDKVTSKAVAMTDAVKDAAIVAAINTKLAQDKALQATRIDVDAHLGHVTLQGSAPDAEARDRATVLAQGTDGVLTVDNHIKLAS